MAAPAPRLHEPSRRPAEGRVRAQPIRSLTADEINQLLAYERARDRPAAIQIFQHRLAELAAGETPTPGRHQYGPDFPPPPHGDSPVKPQKAPPGAVPRQAHRRCRPNRTVVGATVVGAALAARALRRLRDRSRRSSR